MEIILFISLVANAYLLVKKFSAEKEGQIKLKNQILELINSHMEVINEHEFMQEDRQENQDEDEDVKKVKRFTFLVICEKEMREAVAETIDVLKAI